jgi:hypothetical protein
MVQARLILRLLHVIALTGFVVCLGFLVAQAQSTQGPALLAYVERLGFKLSPSGSFDDSGIRANCSFAPSGNRTLFSTSSSRGSGLLSADGLSAVEVVIQDNGTQGVTCLDKVSISGLSFEEAAIVSAEVEMLGIRSPEQPSITANANTAFEYNWKTLESAVSLEAQVYENSSELGYASIIAGLDGIDFIKLQVITPQQNQAALNDLLAAGFSSLQIEFVDRGIIEQGLNEEAKSSGKTARTMRREAYTTLEQYRSVFDPANETVIGETITLLQNIVLEGGGGKITVEPNRSVKFIEFLNEQTLINLLSEMTISVERIP